MHGLLSAESLGALDVKVVAEVIAASTDVALVLAPDGIIQDISIHPSHRENPRFRGWVGQPWSNIVTWESRPKVDALLRQVEEEGPARSREINHQHEELGDFPVRYSTIALGNTGGVLAIGRELSTLADLQQQLMNAQQAMEREYARLRNAETRYRLLFQISSEAVVITDADTLRISEANPAAMELAAAARERIEGRPLTQLFDTTSQVQVTDLLNTILQSRTGTAPGVQATLGNGGERVTVSATVFRQGAAAHFLVRLERAADARDGTSEEDSRLLRVLEGFPDAFVVVDSERRVLTANASFFDLAQVATESQLHDQPLDRWLGRPGVDLNIMMANLKEHGSVRNFATVVQGELGSVGQVDVSAVEANNGEDPCYGFMLRTVQTPTAVDPSTADLPQSVQELTGLVGRVSLKEIVRETTDVIERLCIEAALEVSGGNRASAAQILGLSRQSLYSKLRRHQLSAYGEDEV